MNSILVLASYDVESPCAKGYVKFEELLKESDPKKIEEYMAGAKFSDLKEYTVEEIKHFISYGWGHLMGVYCYCCY